MQKHIIDLFNQDKSVYEIKATHSTRYILMHNLLVEVHTDIVTGITILQKVAVDNPATYYYDILEPKCIQAGVDFISLLFELLNHGITTDDLMVSED